MRIYEATKELNISKEETKKLLEQVGITVKTTAQSIDDETFQKIKALVVSKSDAKKPAKDGEKAKEVKKAPEAKAPPIKEAPKAAPAQKPEPAPKTPEEIPVPAAEEVLPKPQEIIETVEEPVVEGGKEQPKQSDKKVVRIPLGLSVKDFAELIGHSGAEIIKKMFTLGEMVTINQQISLEAINVLADEFDFTPEIIEEPAEEFFEELPEGTPEPRPPVVTVMGHVDHGKTSLLDAVRKTNVISGEAGGITQHIGAYQIAHNDKFITFIDTPGHQAFTAMRARGAKITDIAVLVVAADDGVKAQTVEALDHARAAGVPVIVAVNKIDKPEANPDKVKNELSELGLVPEEWGGDTIFVHISAKHGTNIEGLLEMIQLVADMAELKAPKDVPGMGIVIEAKLEKGRGPVTSLLVQRGVLSVGNIVVAGEAFGRIRALVDDKGHKIKTAPPSTPIEILGLSPLPEAGDDLIVVPDERKAKQIAEMRKDRREAIRHGLKPGVDSMQRMMGELGKTELKLVVKADVQGSLEAMVNEFEKLTTEEVKVSVIHKGVGAITESDVMLANASEGLIIGFNVRPSVQARDMAEKEGVELRLHKVIYQAADDIRAASLGMLKPLTEEEEVGRLEVREVFKVPKFGQVAGSYVVEGEINRDNQVRLVRDGVVVYDGKISSLRRFKDDTSNVKFGYECGVGLENFKDVKEGDVIEVYKTVEKPRI